MKIENLEFGSKVHAELKNNIFPQKGHLNRNSRNRRFGHKSGVVWLTGLSGSGKSTIAAGAEQILFNKKFLVSILDGDNVRAGLNADLDFSEHGRFENLRRVAELAALFAESGHVVLATFVSPFREARQKARTIVADNFYMVHIKATLDVCMSRDPNGLYKKAKAGEIGNFTGLGQRYEMPKQPDLVIDTDHFDIQFCQKRLARFIEENFLFS